MTSRTTTGTKWADRSAVRSSTIGSFSSARSRRVSTRRTNEYLFSSGTDPGEISRDQTIMSAYGKVSYASRRMNAYFGALLTPTTSRVRCRPIPASGPQYISSSKASNDVNLDARLRDRTSETSLATLISTSSNTTFLSVKVGHFLRQLRGHRRSVDHTVVLRDRRAWPETPRARRRSRDRA